MLNFNEKKIFHRFKKIVLVRERSEENKIKILFTYCHFTFITFLINAEINALLLLFSDYYSRLFKFKIIF